MEGQPLQSSPQTFPILIIQGNKKAVTAISCIAAANSVSNAISTIVSVSIVTTTDEIHAGACAPPPLPLQVCDNSSPHTTSSSSHQNHTLQLSLSKLFHQILQWP